MTSLPIWVVILQTPRCVPSAGSVKVWRNSRGQSDSLCRYDPGRKILRHHAFE